MELTIIPKEKVKKLKVTLEQQGNQVALFADGWAICTLTEDGYLQLHQFIGSDTGLQVNSRGIILLKNS